jgi:hypothetical protein
MMEDRDHYAELYATRLWNLLPQIYREWDGEGSDSDETGPLRELTTRVGEQMAIVRRSIDRLHDDQSIELCDNWVIPYLGDLLATNLVANLDARGQRLDVAKTIYYRRRKGTVGLLEELAADITGWNARVVEFFRRMARTRHQYDPPIGRDRILAVIEGLVGTRSGTPAGGLADLRNRPAALSSGTAFDEFFHTADLRRGRQLLGWHNIPKLGVFLWRLKSFGCSAVQPVPVDGCDGYYTFDPTGREIPLFARDYRGTSQYGDAWVTPDEWMLPGPIASALWEEAADRLYGDSLAAIQSTETLSDVIDPSTVALDPERDRFHLLAPLPAGAFLQCDYHYGFSSKIGAGPYDRRDSSTDLPAQPSPASVVSGGGAALQLGLAALPATGTLAIDDSATYDSMSDLAAVDEVHLRCEMNERPVVRLDGAAWTATGASDSSRLTLEGLFLSGGDVILTGSYETVELLCTTLDPGEAVAPDGSFPTSVDGRPLAPSTLWIEGAIETLVIRRSIVGPVRTRLGGLVETIRVEDSIVQGVRVSDAAEFALGEIPDIDDLILRWKSGNDLLSTWIRTAHAVDLPSLSAFSPDSEPSDALRAEAIDALNVLLTDGSLYTAERFAETPIPPSLAAKAAAGPTGSTLAEVNRLLLEIAYPVALAPVAFASADATVEIVRSTILGPAHAHRLSASESILAGPVSVDDPQTGCVRYSAVVEGSRLHQPYESVVIRERAAVFVSRRFGDPGYAQLSVSADREIVEAEPGRTVSAGAQNGSEMGAFSRELNPIKERALEIKLLEYMPIGLTPVLVKVT